MTKTEDGIFPRLTRERLAKWAGHRCSAPWCDKTTMAGSHSTRSGHSDTGEAAHILGRTPKSARYDKDQLPQDRMDFHNGIWLCRSDATAIDRNDSIYTADLLRQWKETRARAAIEDQTQGSNRALSKLFDFKLTVDLANAPSVDLVHDFLHASGVSAAWGGEAEGAAERLIFEILDNARTHGGAQSANLVTKALKILIEFKSPGGHFGAADLLATKSEKGGYIGAASWTDLWDAQFHLSSYSTSGITGWVLTDIRTGEGVEGPCSAIVGHRKMTDSGTPHDFADDCSEVTIYIEGRISYSDAVQLVPTLDSSLAQGPVLIVSKDLANLAAIEQVKSYIKKDWVVSRLGSGLRLELSGGV